LQLPDFALSPARNPFDHSPIRLERLINDDINWLKMARETSFQMQSVNKSFTITAELFKGTK
jgi:hypothetical protein